MKRKGETCFLDLILSYYYSLFAFSLKHLGCGPNLLLTWPPFHHLIYPTEIQTPPIIVASLAKIMADCPSDGPF